MLTLAVLSLTFLNLFGLLVSSHVVDFKARNNKFKCKTDRAIGIINFERLSPNLIADTMNWFLNSILD